MARVTLRIMRAPDAEAVLGALREHWGSADATHVRAGALSFWRTYRSTKLSGRNRPPGEVVVILGDSY